MIGFYVGFSSAILLCLAICWLEQWGSTRRSRKKLSQEAKQLARKARRREVRLMVVRARGSREA